MKVPVSPTKEQLKEKVTHWYPVQMCLNVATLRQRRHVSPDQAAESFFHTQMDPL
ncbi:hypothetical protein Ga0123462_1872 [Mariprofundus ferrinatatus]|uniref:Uncharacterized protein n=1 Tax=Mariprofundus ferrinatatus TaxID=1921087 RepID=A0A2K8LCT5_9PROT|nr:hypothetical protein Ga0123462_1872 [Mariprofundus ferrinatatus]